MTGPLQVARKDKKNPRPRPRVVSPSALPRPGPAQGGKAGGRELPELNLSNNKIINKINFSIYVVFTTY
jgi:hypothetical protein